MRKILTDIHPLLDKTEQIRARRYERENRLLGLLGSLLTLGIVLGFYFSGLSSYLSNIFPNLAIVWIFLLYFGIFQGFLFLLGAPLSYYSGYVHEHKWKFSNHTRKSWAWEQLKSFFVGLFLMFLVLGLLFWVLAAFPEKWWFIAGLAAVLVSVVFATLFPIVVLPLFNKYTLIDDEQLISALSSILKQGGLKSSGFFKEDMSRQTKKENAFLVGLGRTRRVVLGDNLLDNMSMSEIETIIAHEVGHFKYRHIWKNILLGTIQQLIIFFILYHLMDWLFPGFPASTRENLAVFPIFAILMGSISMLLFGPLSLAISRMFERQADKYALNAVSNKNAYKTALAGLANRNLSNAYPEWWIKLLYYSHPPIGERLLMAEQFETQAGN